MLAKEFADLVTVVEAYCKILAVLIPKVKNGTATPKEQQAFDEARGSLSDCRERMAKAIAEAWERYDTLGAIRGRIPGSGPALRPLLEDLRDLARFKILDEPNARPIWQPRLQRIEGDLGQYGH